MLEQAIIGGIAKLDESAIKEQVCEYIYSLWKNFGFKADVGEACSGHSRSIHMPVYTGSGIPLGYIGVTPTYNRRTDTDDLLYYMDSPYVTKAKEHRALDARYHLKYSTNVKALIRKLKSESVASEQKIIGEILPDSRMINYAMNSVTSTITKPTISLPSDTQLAFIANYLGVDPALGGDTAPSIDRAMIEREYAEYLSKLKGYTDCVQVKRTFLSSSDIIAVSNVVSNWDLHTTYILFRDVSYIGEDGQLSDYPTSYGEVVVFNNWDDAPVDIAATFAMVKAAMDNPKNSPYKDSTCGTGIRKCDRYFEDLDIAVFYRSSHTHYVSIAK
jgi:hypothetical protein